MGKKLLYLTGIIALFAVFSACEEIDEPYLEPIGTQGPGNGEVVRKILLEKFTGHTCVNCPEGKKLADDLKNQYGEQLILLSIHSGNFAVPEDPPYDRDFRTVEGTEIDDFFNVQFYPSGMVNRTKVSGQYALPITMWQNAIEDIVNLPPEMDIELETNFNATDRTLEVTANIDVLTDLSGTYNFAVYITENSIISAQKNDNANIGPVPDILDYEHNHVLRGSVNGAFGIEIITDGATAGEVITKDLETTINADWNEEELMLIAFVYDTGSDIIIQAEELHVTVK